MRARDGILAEICGDGRGRYSGAREAEEGDGTARWARPVSGARVTRGESSWQVGPGKRDAGRARPASAGRVR